MFPAQCESTPEECDCDHSIPIEICINYDVECPPTQQVPAGYTHALVTTAHTCHAVVHNSVCDTESGLCSCQNDDIRYGGAGCYPDVSGVKAIKSSFPDFTVSAIILSGPFSANVN